jgi:hypothetical protein
MEKESIYLSAKGPMQTLEVVRFHSVIKGDFSYFLVIYHLVSIIEPLEKLFQRFWFPFAPT